MLACMVYRMMVIIILYTVATDGPMHTIRSTTMTAHINNQLKIFSVCCKESSHNFK